MKKLISNKKIALSFDIAAIIAIALYATIDNYAVDLVCLVVWGMALIFEMAYKIYGSKHS